jgi:signal transduction histidine kinase
VGVNRQPAIDDPIQLSQLVSDDVLHEVLTGLWRAHGLEVTMFDLDGSVLGFAGTNVRDLSALWDGTEDGERDYDGSTYWAGRLSYEGETLARIALGPYSADTSTDDAMRVFELAKTVLGVIVHSAHARQLTSIMHVAAMEDTFAELTAKNTRLEQAVVRMQELDRLKSGFLATMSHELRTPLTSVIGYSEMLLEGLAGALNDEQRDYVQTILNKADQLLHLITGILDASLIESGGMHMQRDPFPLRDLIESVIATFAPQAAKRSIVVDLHDTGVPRALGDSRKIRQVLWNLLANAIKFTPSGGGVTVDLQVGPLAPVDAEHMGASMSTEQQLEAFGLRVVVRDSGIGIPPEKQAHIFEPFFQVDSSSTREYGGTGLGLTLAKSYVEAHGGRIWVDSALGAGSVFTVSIPAVPGELEAYLEAHAAS